MALFVLLDILVPVFGYGVPYIIGKRLLFRLI
jgi:hypothetical protein